MRTGIGTSVCVRHREREIRGREGSEQRMSSISLDEMKHRRQQHILLLPWLALGHMKPFVELAKLIQRRRQQQQQLVNLSLTILTTPRNVPLLHKLLPVDEQSSTSSSSTTVIQVRELPFRSSDHEGLPANVENTHGLGLSLLIKLCRASTSLEAPLRSYIAEEIVGREGSPPLCIITDFFHGWAVDVARSFGCPGIVFSTGGTYGIAAYMCVCNELPHRKQTDSDDGTFTLSAFPETHRFHQSQLHRYIRAADGNDEWSRFFQPQFRKSMSADGWLCNTAEELEPLGMSILRNYLKLPVWAVGPAVPLSAFSPDPGRLSIITNDDKGARRRVLTWLDSQPERSVLYISFGSQNTITAGQMMELAKGLEESGRRFVWVVRPPFGFDIDGEFNSDEWLPSGFEERVRDRGLILHKWGPQMEILAHKSTGVFLTHCGWNSVVESLSQGIPMIGWPLAAEQAYNSKMLVEEMGVAVELTRGLEGELTSSEVKRVLGWFFDKGEGTKAAELMKRKAVDMSKQLKAALQDEGDRKGSSLKSLDDFLHHILAAIVVSGEQNPA